MKILPPLVKSQKAEIMIRKTGISVYCDAFLILSNAFKMLLHVITENSICREGFSKPQEPQSQDRNNGKT